MHAIINTEPVAGIKTQTDAEPHEWNLSIERRTGMSSCRYCCSVGRLHRQSPLFKGLKPQGFCLDHAIDSRAVLYYSSNPKPASFIA
jgi:hypothetical protein